MWCQMGNVITYDYKVGKCDRKCSQVAESHDNTRKCPEGKSTDDDPWHRSKSGPIWIATYRMDENPLRYVSETKWMNFHLKKGMNIPFSRSWMTRKLRMKA